jgi:uncharacterized membrane protein YhfC
MGKKLALNVLYNIVIFLCLITAYWSFGNKRYEFILAAVFVGAIFIVLKIKLIKEIKNPTKKV